MVNPEIISYIKKAHEMKVSDQQITTDLLKNGWSEAEIREGIAEVTGKPQSSVLVVPLKPTAMSSHGMWDAFEHILLFISLYVMSTAIAFMLHYFVDEWVPGIVLEGADYYYRTFYTVLEETLLRGYIAALIVSMPLFIFFFLDVTKRTLRDQTMRNIRARKILIYITHIMTFLIMLGHVISIIFVFLSGNVDLNNFLHLVVTVAVNGVIFAYYMLQVKQDRRVHA